MASRARRRSRRRSDTGFWFAISGSLLLLASAAVLLSPAVASAEPVEYELPADLVTEPPLPEELPECPAAPGPYESEEPDAVVAELRAARIEAVEVCEALTALQVEQLTRLWWLTAESVEAHAQRQLGNEKLTAVVESLASPVVVDWEGTQEVQDVGSADVIEAVDASGEALKSALWFAIGVAACSILGYGIFRMGLIKP